ncbi:MAG: hypothetical protein ACUVWN_10540 [bacterium]
MAIFEYLPEQIKKAVLEHISKDEQIKMCFIAGSSLISDKDYVVITNKRVMVMDERNLGYLGKSYVNIKEDVSIDQITSIEVSSTFRNKLFRQLNMNLQVDRYTYLIKNGDMNEIKKAVALIKGLAGIK